MESKISETENVVAALIKEGTEIATEYAFSVLGAVVILIVGFLLARLVARWARQSLLRVEAIDLTLATFLANIIRYGLWVLVIVMVLSQFGVQTTSIIAVLGAAGLAIGLAMQGTLSNIAAGVMLLILRPFKIGEYIDGGGVAGTVRAIGLFTTELKRIDGLFVVVPNSQLWTAAITNYTRNPIRRFELIIGIDYDDSMAEAREALLDLARNDERVLDDPEPQAFVAALVDSSVNIGLRVWMKAEDYLLLSWDLTEAAKARFDDVGLSIPFPQRQISHREAGDS